MTTSIIVGGSSGLGRAVAQRFADRGDTVLITSRTTARAPQAEARTRVTAPRFGS
ncbi:SDR family NAD(P)-dependent oxidoreductase [Streptomyces sp. NPDC006539]|uniref:SDR family NAD(P)-dependent oxidoreductase n=1 Tax=Streptomyces sp. NPDC006539 TaxID=3155352 RepID=UPI00339E4F64